MWLLFAFGSAIFAGITAILAKIGIKKTDSYVATALRTVVVLIFAWLMVFVAGSAGTLPAISLRSHLFLGLSGLTTGASWICYFKALQLGDVNKVVPIDKSSTVMTMVLAFLILGEPVTIFMALGMTAIGAGTYMMIQKKESKEDVSGKSKPAGQMPDEKKTWFFFALFSAVFASFTSILGKMGIEGVESNLGTALRTIVVLLMAWAIVFGQNKQGQVKNIDPKSWFFILVSGLTTGLSWLCYYRALKEGRASIVVPVDKLSIVVSVGFASLFLKEKLNRKSFAGLLLIVVGTLILLIK